MTSTRITRYFLPEATPAGIALVLVFAVAIVGSEALLYLGHVTYTIWAYSLLLFGLSLVPLVWDGEMAVVQAFALLPVFRLVNIAMPVFFEPSLARFPLIYGPFILVFAYLGLRSTWPSWADSAEDRRSPPDAGGITQGLPWWLGGERGGKGRWLLGRLWQFLTAPNRSDSTPSSILHWVVRGLVVVTVPVAIGLAIVLVYVGTYYLASVEFALIAPEALVPSLDVYYLVVLTVVMVWFVGFVEELLFRGALQQVLERRIGLIPGLLLASGLYAVMHSGNGLPMEIAFAGGVGLLFGIVYDVTDSLLLVAVSHGLVNVFLFGVIPLGGPSPADLLGTMGF